MTPSSRNVVGQIFLCHGKEDKPAIRRLYKQLRRRGIPAWLDEVDIPPGADFALEIQKAVECSGAILVCLSTKSVSRPGYIQKEIALALDLASRQPEGTNLVIPIRLDACEIPKRLSHLNALDLFRPNQAQKLFEALRQRPSEVVPVPVLDSDAPSKNFPISPPAPIRARSGPLTRRLYVDARVHLPRLEAVADVSFLVDTGADSSLLMPSDVMRLGISSEQVHTLRNHAHGIGGTVVISQEPAILVFADTSGALYCYEIDISICSQKRFGLPSILGRDVMQNWRLSIDFLNDDFRFDALRADVVLPASQ